MPYDSLRDCFSLRRRGVEVILQESVSEHAAVEFETHPGSRYILICSADVVEEAGEEVCLVRKTPIGKLLLENCLACPHSQQSRNF